MTTTTAQSKDAAQAACRALGMDPRGLTPLRVHATAVYFLPGQETVVRVSPGARGEAIERATGLTRWLAGQGFPCVEPLHRPVHHEQHVVSFWRHYPQDRRKQPPAEHLGGLLRQLHDLPPPPLDLPVYQPLATLRQAVTGSSFLTQEIRAWLIETCDHLLRAYQDLEFPLGIGLVHADAYPGNTLWDGNLVRLGDWDEAATGPRELDLANTYQGIRFGRLPEELDAFTRAYGYDPRTWEGLPVLIAIRDLHTLGPFIRRADTGDTQATVQLQHRLDTLRSGDTATRWDIF
ncbi:phosphotransferase enzyme family protein [Streptomyces sp. QH1-20]|uniref:phosphotransferase enzyme family protein n=1 Tax=Streptomyces sp. QH1-20 TaxID=3240934 RepID=UPI0035137506